MTWSGSKITQGQGISTHILTRRMTQSAVEQADQKIFQLTSSRGGWQPASVLQFFFSYFNSHPHEEDDSFFEQFGYPINISTHILTRRMTYPSMMHSISGNISTHILTRRMTFKVINEHFCYTISTHILTRRMTKCFRFFSVCIGISTHILTRRMTSQFCTAHKHIQHFNSHPHEEDDMLILS